MFYLLQQYRSCRRRYLSFFIVSSVAVFLFYLYISSSSDHRKVIAITQIIGHESLDKVRQGVIDGLAQDKALRIIFKNAQGNITTAAQIAQQLVAMHPAVVVAIATSSAQTVANSAHGTSQAIVFSSVTDPVEAKLVGELHHPGKNITGTRNVTPVAKEIQLMKQVLPNIKTIGIVLNEGEVNSLQLRKAITTEANSYGISVKSVSIATSADVQLALMHLIGKVDALFLLQDNTVASALPVVLSVCKKHNLPVFSAFLDAVKAGALASFAGDEYAIGQQTAKIVLQILSGKNPGDIPVEDPAHIKLALNLATAKQLHLKFQRELVEQAEIVVATQEKNDESH